MHLKARAKCHLRRLKQKEEKSFLAVERNKIKLEEKV